MINQFRIYKITQPAQTIIDALEGSIVLKSFEPCGSSEVSRSGFIPPINDQEYAPVISGISLMCIKTEEKILPSQVINEAVAEKVDRIEDLEGRPVGRKERLDIKDEVIIDLLPKAFTKSKLLYGYIDSARGILVIGSASCKAAEEFCSMLREAIGSLPVIPVRVSSSPAIIMTGWVQNKSPEELNLGYQCKMIDHDGAAHTCRNQDLGCEALEMLLASGMMVDRMELFMPDVARFNLDSSLAFRQMKLSDVLLDSAGESETEEARKETDFILVSSAIRQMYDCIGKLMGGWVEQQSMDIE